MQSLAVGEMHARQTQRWSPQEVRKGSLGSCIICSKRVSEAKMKVKTPGEQLLPQHAKATDTKPKLSRTQAASPIRPNTDQDTVHVRHGLPGNSRLHHREGGFIMLIQCTVPKRPLLLQKVGIAVRVSGQSLQHISNLFMREELPGTLVHTRKPRVNNLSDLFIRAGLELREGLQILRLLWLRMLRGFRV